MSRFGTQVLVAPWDRGQLKSGVKSGANLLWHYWKEYYSLRYPCNIITSQRDEEWNSYMDRLNYFTKISLDRYKKTIVLGGDHSISEATVPAFFDQYGSSGHLIWVDAHPDIQLPETSPSGNRHGMPMSVILGTLESSVNRSYIPNPRQISYVGIRDIDRDERDRIKLLESEGLGCYYGPDLLDFG